MSKHRSNPRRRVGIDTNIMIYSLAESNKASKDEAFLIKQSRRILSALRGRRDYICVSAISIAEYLVKIDKTDHEEVMRSLGKLFVIFPFNLKAVSLTAEIRAGQRPSGAEQRLRISSDIKILASMKSEHVDVFYTHDTNLLKLAPQYLHDVRDIIDAQRDLFEWAADSNDVQVADVILNSDEMHEKTRES